MISEEQGDQDHKGKHKIVYKQAPTDSGVFTQNSKKKFNELPGYVRHLINRLIEHGSLELACEEAGVDNKGVELTGRQLSTSEVITSSGLDASFISDQLKLCLKATQMKQDTNGNWIPDYRTRLKAVELICKLRGDFNVEKETVKENVLEMFEAREDD
jgi:hypothetical protein